MTGRVSELMLSENQTRTSYWVNVLRITCPSCSSLNIKKNGKTANQKQRYRCKDGGRQLITGYTCNGCRKTVRDLGVPMALNSSGIRDIARVLRISPNTVLQIIRDEAAQVTEPSLPHRVKDLEIDEFWSFIGAKARQHWCWYAWDRQRKRITAFVPGRRTDENCRRLLKKHEACLVKTDHTDDWQSDRKLLPPRRHQIQKSGTQRIERRNLDFRTRIKRLQRRTICFSKCPKMHYAVMKLYIHHSNS